MPSTYIDMRLVYLTEAQSNPCAVANSELNAGGKPMQLFHSKNTVTTVEGQIEEWRGVAFVSNFSWLVLKRHATAKLEMGTLTIPWKIQWTTRDFLACAVKMQHLCLLRCALDRAKTCSDELLATWLLQVEQFLSDTGNKKSWVHDGSEPLILSMIRATHDYYYYWYMFVSPNRGTKQPLHSWQ